MEFKGKVTHKSRIEKIGAKATDKITIVMEETVSQYPNSITIDFIGDKTDLVKNVEEGGEYLVHLNLKASEYNGRYYNRISGRKVETIKAPVDKYEWLPF